MVSHNPMLCKTSFITSVHWTIHTNFISHQNNLNYKPHAG